METVRIIDSFIKKYMPWLILAALVGGYFMGLDLTKTEIKAIKSSIMPAVIIMIYAMLVTMKMEELKNALIYPKELIYGSILSLLVAPLLMIPLASVFTNNAQLYTGLILASIVPPGGMITYWTGILEANMGLATAIQTVTLLVAIIWVPYGMQFFVGSQVAVNTSVLLIKIVMMVVVPLLLAFVTQKFIVNKFGWKGIVQIKPLSHLISSVLALYIVFIAPLMQAHAIEKHPSLVLLPAVGMLIYYSVAYPFSYYLSLKVFKIPHDKSIPITYGFATKNLSIAMGLAIAAFGPMALLGVVPCILFQMPFASLWFKIFSKMNKKISPETLMEESNV